MPKISAATAASAGPDQTSTPEKPGGKPKRSAPLSQLDVPGYTIREALRIPEALRDQFAKQPTSPFDVAIALDMSLTGGPYKMLTGAAIAYGLTEGGAQANEITLTDLGRRIVSPTAEGEDEAAMREAVLKPRVVREFLSRYDKSPLPARQIALNVIEQMNVPASATDRAYEMILKNGQELGLIIELKGKKFVHLDGVKLGKASTSTSMEDTSDVEPGTATVFDFPSQPNHEDTVPEVPQNSAATPSAVTVVNHKVFITHGKNTKVVEQIKKILTFGKFDAVVSVDHQTMAKPVPDKVMDDMRECNAAIVHVGAERTLLDADGGEVTEINPNVLIEIGAAMALYGRRFVLLVERGVKLPSNLQGLYEVRYEGEQLDHDATMKLLEAFNDFR